MKKYFPADLVYVYPSANSKDGGDDNSEKNLAIITDKFTISNFIVRNKSVSIDQDTSLSLIVNSDGNLVIKQGACSISGYYVSVQDTVVDVADCIADAQEHQWNIYETVYDIYIQLHMDGAGLVRGDSGITLSHPQDVCYGVSYKFIRNIDTDTETNPKIFLGSVGFTTASDTIIFDESSIVLAPNRFSYIDIDTIKGTSGKTLDTDLEYRFRKLSEINYWNNQQDAWDPSKTSDASLKVNTSGIFYRLSSSGSYTSLLDQIIHAPKGAVTPAGTLGNPTNTNNGNSNSLALADHDHDNRYILNSNSYTGLQTISQLKIASKLESLGQIVVGSNTIVLDPSTGLSANALTVSGLSTFTSGINCTGNLTVGSSVSPLLACDTTQNTIGTGATTINAPSTTIIADKVYGAVWNDYADAVKKTDGISMEPGDIISKDLNGDYTLSTEKYPKLVVGVYSDSYGHLLGGDPDKTLEENLKVYAPIAVAGNVRVKVVGTAKAGDLIIASSIPGVGKVSETYVPGTVIGKVLEDKDTEEVSRVLMQVMLI